MTAEPYTLLPSFDVQGFSVEDIFLHLAELRPGLLFEIQPVDEAQLLAVEETLKATLPAGYRAAVKMAGGGWGSLQRRTSRERLFTIAELIENIRAAPQAQRDGSLEVGLTGYRRVGDMRPERLMLVLSDDWICDEVNDFIARSTGAYLADVGLRRLALPLHRRAFHATTMKRQQRGEPVPLEAMERIDGVLRHHGLERHPFSGGQEYTYLSALVGVRLLCAPLRDRFGQQTAQLTLDVFHSPLPGGRSGAVGLVRALQSADAFEIFTFSPVSG
ncbi:MAG: hypothetical protein AAFV53_28130 [Myxococcota bacterium]